MFLTVPRLIRAIQGGDDAPDLLATAENAAINVGGKRKRSFASNYDIETPCISVTRFADYLH